MKTKLIEYAKNLQFGVRDFTKTVNKYKDYKTTKWEALEFDTDTEIIAENGYAEMQKILSRFARYDRIKSKSDIKTVKAYLNGQVYQAIQESIKEYAEWDEVKLNYNEIKYFATRHYIENYDEYNNLMSEYLVDFVTGRL